MRRCTCMIGPVQLKIVVNKGFDTSKLVTNKSIKPERTKQTCVHSVCNVCLCTLFLQHPCTIFIYVKDEHYSLFLFLLSYLC